MMNSKNGKVTAEAESLASFHSSLIHSTTKRMQMDE